MSLTVKLALSPLLVAQALITRRRMPRLPEASGRRQGVAGAARAQPLRLLITGDSSAAGVGVVSQRQALAVQLAEHLAAACHARVHWRLVARSGMTTAQTLHLLQRDAVHQQADVAVVVTGVNDVVEQVPSQRAVSSREALANWLRNGHGVQHVVFAPLPPIHHFPGLPQPLRWVAGADARRHNAAMRRWVRTRGDVSCVDMHMPLTAGMMADDGFHPGEPVYRYCAEAITRHVASQVWPLLRLEPPR
jgi:lysophospholipase L1-like esterase